MAQFKPFYILYNIALVKTNHQINYPSNSITDVEIDPELKQKWQTQEEKQVIIHIMIKPQPETYGIRVWHNTFLIPDNGSHKRKLIDHYNITIYPNWLFIKANVHHRFTLIFQGLPPGCKSFDLLEQIPESGGFEFKNITKNESGVYHLTM